MENKLQHTSVTPKDLTIQFLEEITTGFSDEHKVGSGGYGNVYKGVLHTGEEIAVKKLHPMPGLDDVKFKIEFNNLMRVQHQNIVRLVGYCYGKFTFAGMVERALCFEYLQGGSLDKHLDDESCGLDWHVRYNIIKGICEGLNYLHNGSKKHIVHMDLKPENILLDKNMMPKIADFGLSRLFSTKTYTTNKIIGTPGYMPPEYIDKHHVSPKFDIFSLGVIIKEIMAGRMGHSRSTEISSEQFIGLVHENWKKRLQATMSRHTSLEVKTCIEIALRCVEPDRAKRPTITEIVDELNKMSLICQSSGSKDCLGIDPLELRFPFELNKEISCVLQLTNKTDDTIAFTAKTNQAKYYTQPDKGIMKPWSKCYIIVTMQARKKAPPNMQCNHMFLVQSIKVSEDLTLDNIAEHFKKGMGKVVDEESKLPIVYVALPQPPRPLH